MLKKFVICFFVFSLMCVPFKVHASTKIRNTGHSSIIELGFKDEHVGYKILNQMSNKEVNNAYKKVKRSGFGWNVHVINNCVPIWYISEIVFSKSNKTQQVFTFKYNTKSSTENSVEYSVSGSVGGKLSGKIKDITGSISLDLKGEITSVTEKYYEEKSDFSVVINPGKKISLLVRGDANISTGVGKYFFLWITFSKGTWEYVDFVTEYYEFIEENA